ncbi:hypothetical protein WA1_42950 [Scytonema hofmannii PCC 7110]|uniref:Inactive STAND domain-containing protein n=1 Tax=Scytonema hofmannii PCC 7110 TaxID=128403 RepID=A0A139WVK8_9CYAN|nr:hypothetical protein [Scytonema hofmannii]KYC36464.1 hypothetical protein WA1_42950 [Scytonema hofmannii PCC 7110]
MLNNSDENLQLLQEKLDDFKREYIITADQGRKFQLKKEIKEIKQQIQELEDSSNSYKRNTKEKLPDKNLENALCKLNHSNQYTSFQHVSNICNNLIGVRIQTSKDSFSLVWLLKSLIKSLETEEVICARLLLDSHTYSNGNFQLILKGIAEGLKLPEYHHNSTVEDIIRKIYYKILQEQQHIILLFYGVDSQNKSVMEKILKDFWIPLITKIKTNKKNNNYLLMFWIDYNKKSANWRESYIFPDDPDDSRLKNAETLLNICVTSKFTQKELKNWLEGQDGRSAPPYLIII